MYNDRKIAVVMPAYNAEQTLQRAFDEVCAQRIVDVVIVVDDSSRDGTSDVAVGLSCPGVEVVTLRHPSNRGYGGNQKSCYGLALEHGADIVVMVHPDMQYTPRLVVAMASMIATGLYSCVLGSRILGGHALRDGMPLWKYVANRFLTFAMNLLLGTKLSEFHTGYRAFSADLLRKLPLGQNTDDFAFDAQMLAEITWADGSIGEVSCPTVYTPEASSINFVRSCKYGIGCLATSLLFRLCRWRLARSAKFPMGASKAKEG